jgi:hypothetical protein
MKKIEITSEGLTLLTELTFNQINEMNGFYEKEVFFTGGFAGDLQYLYQALGNLGAYARSKYSNENMEKIFEVDIRAIIISDAIMNNPDSALYSDFKSSMEEKLNRDKSSYLKIKFITETHLMKYIEYRGVKTDDDLLKDLLYKYKESKKVPKSEMIFPSMGIENGSA